MWWQLTVSFPPLISQSGRKCKWRYRTVVFILRRRGKKIWREPGQASRLTFMAPSNWITGTAEAIKNKATSAVRKKTKQENTKNKQTHKQGVKCGLDVHNKLALNWRVISAHHCARWRSLLQWKLLLSSFLRQKAQGRIGQSHKQVKWQCIT